MGTLVKTQEVATKFGKLYVTSNWRNGELETDSYVYFLDSNHNFLDKFSQDYISEWAKDEEKTEQEVINDFIEVIKTFDDIEALLSWFPIDYEIITQDYHEIEDWLFDEVMEESGHSDIEDINLDENECVNRIGNYYIGVRI